jgi:hypothetical protein
MDELGRVFLHPDLLRLTFLVGVVLSMVLYEWRHVSVGGIAVPGYLALTLFLPWIAPVALANAFLVWLLCAQGICRIFVLSARFRFGLFVFVSASVYTVEQEFLLAGNVSGTGDLLLQGVGYIIPGLLAHDFARQGIFRVTVTTVGASALVALVLLGAVLLVPELGRVYPFRVEGPMIPGVEWQSVLVVLSLIAWVFLTRWHHLRCGGILGGAYVSLMLLYPLELLKLAGLVLFTWLLLRLVLERVMLLFGKRRFAVSLLTAGFLSWLLYRLEEVVFGIETVVAQSGAFAFVGVLVTGLIVNDLNHARILSTLGGLAANVLFTLTGGLLVAELVEHGRWQVALPLFLIFTGLVLLGLVRVGRVSPRLSTPPPLGTESQL